MDKNLKSLIDVLTTRFGYDVLLDKDTDTLIRQNDILIDFNKDEWYVLLKSIDNRTLTRLIIGKDNITGEYLSDISGETDEQVIKYLLYYLNNEEFDKRYTDKDKKDMNILV